MSTLIAAALLQLSAIDPIGSGEYDPAYVATAVPSPSRVVTAPASDERYMIEISGHNAKVQPRGKEHFWLIGCSIDTMTDKRECWIVHHRPILAGMSATTTDGGPSLRYFGRSIGTCVGGHDFPGRAVTLRLDKAAPVSSGEGCWVGQAFVNRLLSSRTWLTRRYEWPEDYPQEATVDLDGLAQAIKTMRKVVP